MKQSGSNQSEPKPNELKPSEPELNALEPNDSYPSDSNSSEAITIRFSNIQIASMSSNSGIFTGENSQSGWQVNRKSNNGFGQIAGSHNIAAHMVNNINDNDVIDSPSPSSSNPMQTSS